MFPKTVLSLSVCMYIYFWLFDYPLFKANWKNEIVNLLRSIKRLDV